MPYVQRNIQGQIESVHRQPEPKAIEFLEFTDPELQAFLGLASEPENFERLDAGFVRVVEDLIDVLIAKNLITITDLPPQAQAKLFARKSFRERSAGQAPRLFGNSGFAEVIDDTGFGPLTL
jgi:hypothetical protein